VTRALILGIILVGALTQFELSGGHDPQLEKALELATEAVQTYTTRVLPPYNPR